MKAQLLKSLIAFLIFYSTIIISAKAQIVYTDVIPDMTVNTNGGVYHLDLNNDSITDFNISIQTGLSSSNCSGTKPYSIIIITPVAGNFVATTSTSPTALIAGATINIFNTWSSGALYMAKDYWQCVSGKQQSHHWHHYTNGQWLNATDKYLGLKFTSGGHTYFGWTRLSAQVFGNATANFTIKDYAYYALTNQAILAGQSCAVIATLSVNGSTSLCKGDSTTLSATPGFSYLWSNGETTSSITVNPIITTTYFVTVNDISINCSVSLSKQIISNSTNVALLQNNGTLYTYSGGNTSTYSWIDCTSNMTIAGINSNIFTPQTNGTYAVVVNHLGCSDTSNCIVVAPTGITENNNTNQLSVYPNPVTNFVTIKIPSDDGGEIRVMNLLGKTLIEFEALSEIKIDVSDFPAGMYVVRWSSGENIQTQKFSVTH